MIGLPIMARRRPLQFRPLLESSDQQEEREARITELLERAQRCQRRIEEHWRSTASPLDKPVLPAARTARSRLQSPTLTHEAH
jgi:hypothetical protein